MEQLDSTNPQLIGGYHLLGRLGAGGMGEVFLGRSERGRTVAVKLVRPELAAQDEFRRRFRQEVQAAQRVGGLWTAPVLDADTEATVPWVATGYIAGPSLHHVVSRSHGPLSEDSVRVLAGGLAYALRDIHAAGLVHRDLKPSNVLVTIDGPRVIDFGIARALDTVTDGGLTRTGAVIGSPGFMAPEQVRGQRITSACDVFCLGSVLAYAASGTMPFGSPDSGSHALMYRIAEEEPDLSELPDGLTELVSDCLRKDPALRPTPEQVLERTGVKSALRDGRVHEPWLPSALLAELARHAVGLLDREHEAPAEGRAGALPAVGSPAQPDTRGTATGEADAVDPGVAEAAGSGPTTGSVEASSGGSSSPADDEVESVVARPVVPGYPPVAPYPQPSPHGYPPSHGYPQPVPQAANTYPSPHTHPYAPGPHLPGHTISQHPAPTRRRSPLVLAAVAVAVALVAGGVISQVLGEGSDRERSEGERGVASPDQAGGGTPDPGKSGEETDSPDPGESDDGKEPDGPARVPEEFVGTWRASFGTDSGGTNTRTLTIRQGGVGDPVMTLVGRGPDHDCRWSATLRSSGPPLELSGSRLTQHTRGFCSPGEWSRLTLRSDGTLKRELVGSGGEPLTYRRTG